jgi:hypothetical protein
MSTTTSQSVLSMIDLNSKSVLQMVAYSVIASSLSLGSAEAALVPIARDTAVHVRTTFCGLGCYTGEYPPGLSEYDDTFTNTESDPLLNRYERPYQTSVFTPTQIYARAYGSSASGGYGEFGGESYSSSFSLQFSLAEPHAFELNGLLDAVWEGYSMGTVSISLSGPLTQMFSIPFDFGSFDIQTPISVSGVMPAGVYTFAVAVGGGGSVVEFSNLSADATLALTPVPAPSALPLFFSALGGLGLTRWRHRKRAGWRTQITADQH